MALSVVYLLSLSHAAVADDAASAKRQIQADFNKAKMQAQMNEALASFDRQGLYLDALRIRAFPFADDILEFVAAHQYVFVVEQNRDAQLRTLLMVEGNIDPAKLLPVLHYDGTPITARFISSEIAQRMAAFNVAPLKQVAM